MLAISLEGALFVVLLLPGVGQHMLPYAFGDFSTHTFTGPNYL